MPAAHRAFATYAHSLRSLRYFTVPVLRRPRPLDAPLSEGWWRMGLMSERHQGGRDAELDGSAMSGASVTLIPRELRTPREIP